jgi:flagellar brake protein
MNDDVVLTADPVAADLSRYLVHSRFEIVAVLRDALLHRALVTVSFAQGRESIVSAFLQINPEFEEVVFDFGADETANRKLIGANSLQFTTFVHNVKIQFSTQAAEATMFEGKPAVRVRLPESLLKLQRREDYRVPTPVARPLKCIVGDLLDATGKPLELRIVDISCGGIGVLTHTSGLSLAVGQEFHDCRIELPGVGNVTSSLLIRNISELNQGKGQRCGCRFVRIPHPMVTLIQRYINHLERDRRSRS